MYLLPLYTDDLMRDIDLMVKDIIMRCEDRLALCNSSFIRKNEVKV